MIHKIKTITYGVRSHGQKTILSDKGRILRAEWDIYSLEFAKPKATLKKTLWHLQDVLKVMNKLEREKEKKKTYEKAIKDLGELLDERKGEN